MRDAAGFTGFILHYCLLFAFTGSAFLVMIYLWGKKRLGMDEEAKYHLFEED